MKKNLIKKASVLAVCAAMAFSAAACGGSGEAPADDTQTEQPAEGEETPADGEETPADGEETPADGEGEAK